MVETDAAFNEFDADGVIRALLPDLLPEEPDALHVLRNAAQHRSEFQRLFALMVQRWHDGEHADNGLETWHSFTSRVQGLATRAGQRKRRRSCCYLHLGWHHCRPAPPGYRYYPSQAFALNWQIINTSLSQLKFRGRDVALASFNSQAHVQLLRAPELVTYR